ncbi:MAG: hypothetical protein NTV79_01775 [Candidatus Aureabacteria bacterium]|nr:hypothetical protein [Candidatus Auribacterota bacterium]
MLIQVLNRLKRQKPAPTGAPTAQECKFCFSVIPIKATRCSACASQL